MNKEQLSKPISQTDDGSKQFIIDSLKGDSTGGFDIDSIYFVNETWYLYEYLKCENIYMTPHTSHPRRYPWNWRKFMSLWKLTRQLNGRLFLVNYSDREADRDEVKIMEVIDFKIDRIKEWEKNRKGPCDYMTIKETNTNREEFSKYLRNINKKALEIK